MKKCSYSAEKLCQGHASAQGHGWPDDKHLKVIISSCPVEAWGVVAAGSWIRIFWQVHIGNKPEASTKLDAGELLPAWPPCAEPVAGACWRAAGGGWSTAEAARSWSHGCRGGFPNAKLSSVPACLRVTPLRKDRLLPRAQTCTCWLIYLLCLFFQIAASIGLGLLCLSGWEMRKKILKKCAWDFLLPVPICHSCDSRAKNTLFSTRTWRLEGSRSSARALPSQHKASGISGSVFLSI